jgi:hypothetical protein
MRLGTIVAFWLLAIGLHAADWSIEIVGYRADEPLQVIRFGDTEVYVGLRNISGHELMLWKDSCSWGGENLTFEVTRANGQTFRLQKTLDYYYSNHPDPQWVEPNGLFSLKVNFNQIWGSFPKDWKSGEKVKLCAIYSEQRDESWNMMDNPSELKKAVDQLKANFKGPPDVLKGAEQNLTDIYRKRADLFHAAWIGRVVSQPITVRIYTNFSTLPH